MVHHTKSVSTITKYKKEHTLTEGLVLPAVTDLTTKCLGQSAANYSITIQDTSKAIKQQSVRIKANYYYSLLLDKSNFTSDEVCMGWRLARQA